MHGAVGKGNYALADNVAWLKADDGSSRVFDLERSSFGLNESATRMLDGVLSRTVDATIENLAREFLVDRSALCADMAELVERLEGAGIIIRSGQPKNRDRTLLQRIVGSACHLVFGRIISRLPSIESEATFALPLFRMALKFISLSELAAILDRSLPPQDLPVDQSMAERIVNEVEATLMSSVQRGPLETACKERALCCWFMLRQRRVPAELVIGVTLSPVSGHSWCQYGGRIVADTIERCCDFAVIWRH